MSSVWVEIKVGGGAHIDDATREAIALANRLQCPVHFEFCGVSCWGEPGDDPARFARQFTAAQEAGGKYPSCTSRDMVAYLREQESRERMRQLHPSSPQSVK
jgi:hypothetical protein